MANGAMPMASDLEHDPLVQAELFRPQPQPATLGMCGKTLFLPGGALASDGKVCVHCREVNPVDARECRNCGRYFIHRPGAGRVDDSPGLEALKQPEVLCALVLLVSLFLPWFSILFFSLSAVQLLGLFKGGGSSMSYGAGATLALARFSSP